jgi:hypothetical protein
MKKPTGCRVDGGGSAPKQYCCCRQSGTATSMLKVVCETPNQSAKMRSE